MNKPHLFFWTCVAIVSGAALFLLFFTGGCSAPVTLPGVTLSGYGFTAAIPPMVIPAKNVPQTVDVPVTIPASSVPTVITGSIKALPTPPPEPTPAKTSLVMPHPPGGDVAFLPFRPRHYCQGPPCSPNPGV